jgi:hypothetical protein
MFCTVGTSIGYGLDVRDSVPENGKVCLSFIASSPALGPIQPPPEWVPGTISRRVTAAGHKPDHSHLPSVEVKNGGVILPFPIRLHGVVLN